MSKLILKSGQDPFYRNYLGTSLVSRNDILYTRVKRVTRFKNTSRRQNIHRVEKTTWESWKSLLSIEQATFVCYHLTYSCLHSGYHVFSAVNTYLNYANLSVFNLVRTISLPPSIPHTPVDFSLSYVLLDNSLVITCADDYSPPLSIKVMFKNRYSTGSGPLYHFVRLGHFLSDFTNFRDYLDNYSHNTHNYYFLQAIDSNGLISNMTSVLSHSIP